MKTLLLVLLFTNAVLVSCIRRPDYAIILAGNSIPANVLGLPFEAKFSSWLPQALKIARLPGNARVIANLSISGQLTTQMLQHDAPLLAQVYQADRPTVLVAYEGTNDLRHLVERRIPHAGIQAYQHLKRYFIDRKTQFPLLLTVTGTVLPRLDISCPEVFERERLILNDQLRQAWQRRESWLNGLADPAHNLRMLHLNTSGVQSIYYHDYVHPSVAGLDEITPLFARATSDALANALTKK